MTTLTALGQAIPAGEAHAVSVSLPTWRDVTGYEEGETRVVDAMQIGYPRFFINKQIQALASWCLERYGEANECCYLFPSQATAQGCVAFLKGKKEAIPARIVQTTFQDQDKVAECSGPLPSRISLFIVLLPEADKAAGKEYWQHTGDGISSRFAARCLQTLSLTSKNASSGRPDRSPDSPKSARGFGRNKHYSRTSLQNISALSNGVSQGSTAAETGPECDASGYVEERYGRNLTKALAPLAKSVLRRRIAEVLSDEADLLHQDQRRNSAPSNGKTSAESLEAETARLTNLPANTKSTRGVSNLDENDVYLYPTGMSAIFHAHLCALRTTERQGRRLGKSVCFGFPYTDTLKILEKWGPGCHHFGNGTDQDLDELENLLERQTDEDRVIALHTEFPSNPLLRAADLSRLRRLADKHDFLIIIDETIGTFANVEVLPFADIAVSSLTKIFSGDANVMGGSLVLNRQGRHYERLQETLAEIYEDNLFEDDAVFIERNSRDYKNRIITIDRNAEQLCDRLKERLEDAAGIATIHYPKFTTPQNYARCLRKHQIAANGQVQPGYGGLFSITFNTQALARTFFDRLACEKGPSLGTNFTLACPYTILAHYNELDWTQRWGVSENLVRVSVGLEEYDRLWQCFEDAVAACEEAADVQ